jgi:hypothetical protein
VKYLTAALLISVASVANAQVTNLSQNPTVTFTVSADHNATTIDGQPKLTSYQLDVMAQNNLGAIAFSQGLGKPTPNAANDATVAVPNLRNLAVNVVFVAKVTALGNGDPGVSALSNPFAIIVQSPLASPANVRVN